MSDYLRADVDRMRLNVLSPRYRAQYDAARARQPAFSEYPDVASLLAAFGDSRMKTIAIREGISRALLAEYFAGGDRALWSSLLVLGFFPMLSNLRYRVVCEMRHRDRDQIVLAAFLFAVDALPPRERIDRVALRLRQRTARQVFQIVDGDHGQPIEPRDVDEIEPDGLPSEHLRDAAAPDQEKLIDLAELITRAGEQSPELLGVLMANFSRHELLREYVARVVTADEQTRERAYQRLKRQRTRLLRRIRALLRVEPQGLT